jgi:TRAP-type C4-dicarboxylate transport system substrate-binding protein
MWSGFNLIANLGFWRRVPEDVREVVNQAVAVHVARQRAYTEAQNRALEVRLAGERGMVFNQADAGSFRAALAGGFERRWRDQLGERAWKLLPRSGGE